MDFGLGASIEDSVQNITPEMIASAKKWAGVYGVPAEWVVATILAESRGNPRAVGDYHIDPKGASIGLMQVNTRASADPLKRAKVTRQMLFNPDTNIQWGTMILRAKYNKIADALRKAKKPLRGVPTDILTRLLYTGVDTVKHIYRGTDPRPNAKPTVYAWNQAIDAASALV